MSYAISVDSLNRSKIVLILWTCREGCRRVAELCQCIRKVPNKAGMGDLPVVCKRQNLSSRCFTDDGHDLGQLIGCHMVFLDWKEWRI